MSPLRLLAALAVGGCGAPSLVVPSYPQPAGAPARAVGSAPPPALIEHLDGSPPAKGCLWADGQWVWVPDRWDWHPGSWIRPPDGCRYSGPTLEWAPGGPAGILYYRPGRWYSERQLEPCPDPVSCPVQSSIPTRVEGARS